VRKKLEADDARQQKHKNGELQDACRAVRMASVVAA
jgi:hypothetical protein